MEKGLNILEVDSVEMNYGANRLLSDIYLKCRQGEITGILGRNGSGKSTLLKIIFGILPADSASVRINGATLSSGYIKDRLIAYLPQHHFIPPSMKVSQALSIYGVDIQTACGLLPEIEKLLSAKPVQLSGGEHRLIEILLVLYSRSKFCLLDEPFSGLSPVMMESVVDLVNQARISKGILITDHHYRQVTKMSDTLYMLVNGQARMVTHSDELIRYGYVPDRDQV
ncbi:MAG: ATP-binding cassette domain-containing protein [Chryseolinea sp.]